MEKCLPERSLRHAQVWRVHRTGGTAGRRASGPLGRLRGNGQPDPDWGLEPLVIQGEDAFCAPHQILHSLGQVGRRDGFQD